MEKKNIFRQESIDRLASPEQMNDYIRVSNPGVFLVLATIILLLVGICVWGSVARFSTAVDVFVVSSNGAVTAFVPEAYANTISEGMPARIDGKNCNVSSLAQHPVQAEEVLDAYQMHLSGYMPGEWVLPVSISGELPEGNFSGDIETESFAPIRLVMN